MTQLRRFRNYGIATVHANALEKELIFRNGYMEKNAVSCLDMMTL